MGTRGPRIGAAKVCTACGVEKGRDEFYPRAGTPYVQSTCRACTKLRSKQRYQDNKDHFTDRRLRRDFGITLEDYNAMLKAQCGTCAICGGSSWSGRLPCVDHDHKTGKVRGLLCNACNLAIGYFNDDAAAASRAADYLRRFNH